MVEPLVTVAVPFFNQGRFLDDVRASIFQQEVPVEIFVLDGGSSDNSHEVIRKWEHRLARWRSHADDGQAAAINEGIAQGRIPYVCWPNSDDWFLPDGLAKLVSELESHTRLDDTNIVVDALDESQRDVVLLRTIGGDFIPTALDHLGELRLRLQPLTLECSAPVVEEAPRPRFASVVPQLPERFVEQIRAHVAAGQIAYAARLTVVPSPLRAAATAATSFFERRTKVMTRAFGSPNTAHLAHRTKSP